MVETIQGALTQIRDILDWAPNNVTGAIILAVAAVLALLLHAAIARVVQRLVSARNPYLAGVLAGTRRLGQIGLLIVALFIALPAAPFDREIATSLATALLIAAIVLIGWSAITASHIVADLYLLQFPARRRRQPARPQAHHAGARAAAGRRHAADHRDDRRRTDDLRARAPIRRQPVRLRRRCGPRGRLRGPAGALQPDRRHSDWR